MSNMPEAHDNTWTISPSFDPSKERISLEWLISQPKFLKPLWDDFSVPQQVFVKAFYGMPLTTEAEHRAWAILNDSCEVDELGFVTRWVRIPYEPKEYSTLAGKIGRRAGKSMMSSFILLYEILFGGHLAHAMPGMPVIVPYVAQDLATAKNNMKYVSILAQKNPRLAKEIITDSRDSIVFRNGITVEPSPPTIKSGRGISVPILVMDEVAFWYKTADNANPDYEVLNSFANAQAQFPHGKILMISTPYTEEGLLWEHCRAGTDGQFLLPEDRGQYQDCLVLSASTASMENPKISRKALERIYARDPEIFVRESLAKFVSSQSNFIPGALVDACTDKGIKHRRRFDVERTGLRPNYVAVMDPAFRGDDFAFSIGHMDERGFVIQDFLQVWSPDKKLGIHLKPDVILGQISQFLKEWGINVVYSDQFHMDSLQSMAMQMGFSIMQQTFSSKSKALIYDSLNKLLQTKRIKLLDVPEIRQQLSQLNKKRTALGQVQIAAPPGKKDDIATVCALLAHVSLMNYPTVSVTRKEPSLFQQLVAKHKKRTEEATWDGW